MRLIVAGCRDFRDLDFVAEAIDTFVRTHGMPSTLISGTAKGVDTYAEYWAADHGVPVEQYPAKWDIYGPSAGPKRNMMMVANADALLAIWDGRSKGTKNIIRAAQNAGLLVEIAYFVRP